MATSARKAGAYSLATSRDVQMGNVALVANALTRVPMCSAMPARFAPMVAAKPAIAHLKDVEQMNCVWLANASTTPASVLNVKRVYFAVKAIVCRVAHASAALWVMPAWMVNARRPPVMSSIVVRDRPASTGPALMTDAQTYNVVTAKCAGRGYASATPATAWLAAPARPA